jgi:hypothetical protein
VNALREMKRGRKRTLTRQVGWNFRLAVSTAAMFWGMTILWSLWSADSMEQWVGMWSVAARVDVTGLVLIALVTGGFLYAGGRVWDGPARGGEARTGFIRQPAMANVALMIVLLAVSAPLVNQQLGSRFSRLVTAFRTTTLNARDAAIQQRGYYEQLDNMGRVSGELWELEERKPADWMTLKTSSVYRARKDFLMGDIRPNASILFNGQVLSSNGWGMRDRPYSLQKPSGTVRIALLGPSLVMGSGVADDETIDVFLEDRLNGAGSEARSFEVLNFGVGGYSIVQQMALLEDRVFTFQPDVVIITLPPRKILESALIDHLLSVVRQGVAIPFPELRGIVDRANIAELSAEGIVVPSAPLRAVARALGLDARMPESEAAARLRGSSDDILQWTLSRIAASVREKGAVPVAQMLSAVVDRPDRDTYAQDLARRYGFIEVDLLNAFDGHDLPALRVAEWDNHPNARGNRLVADRLYEELLSAGPELSLAPAGAAAPPNFQGKGF